MYSARVIFSINMNKIKDDLNTVEEVWDTNFLYMDISISKKRHNSGTPVPNLTQQMACIFISIMYSNFHVDALVKVLDWKWQRLNELIYTL